jgi:hypothetical protein
MKMFFLCLYMTAAAVFGYTLPELAALLGASAARIPLGLNIACAFVAAVACHYLLLHAA